MPTSHAVRILHDHFTNPALNTALSRAMLLRASAGEVAETLRLHVPSRIVAFGKRDTLEPGYQDAARIARHRGFAAIERLAGGRAAVFTEQTIAFAWTIPDPDPRSGIYDRFQRLAAIMVGAFGRLGVTSAIGEIPGEYCPGDYSVHHAGRIKLMGVGQRLARRAAHVGGVVVVDGSSDLRDVLTDVYAALALDWNPATTGALADIVPGTTNGAVVDAILSELSTHATLTEGSLDEATIAMANELAAEHVSPTSVS